MRRPPPESPAQPTRVGIDVGPGAEDVEGALVLPREDARPGRPGGEEALGHEVLVVAGELVVGLDLLLGLGVDLLAVPAEDRPAGRHTRTRRLANAKASWTSTANPRFASSLAQLTPP